MSLEQQVAERFEYLCKLKMYFDFTNDALNDRRITIIIISSEHNNSGPVKYSRYYSVFGGESLANICHLQTLADVYLSTIDERMLGHVINCPPRMIVANSMPNYIRGY